MSIQPTRDSEPNDHRSEQDDPTPASGTSKESTSGFNLQMSFNIWFGLVALLALALVGMAVFWPSAEPIARLVELLQQVPSILGHSSSGPVADSLVHS